MRRVRIPAEVVGLRAAPVPLPEDPVRSTLLRSMVTVSALVGLGTLPAAARAQAPSAVGDWSGTLSFPGGRLPLAFHIQAADPGHTATWDSPAQGANGIPATSVTVEGSVVRITMDDIGASFEGTVSADGDTLAGTFRQGGADLPLTLTRGEAAPVSRPQDPTGPLPYRVEDARIDTPDPAVVLAGTLTMPEGPGPVPAAVLVSGSGPQDRDESLMGHRPFLVLADHLTRHGIAVLRYDDRGVGESTGDFPAATSRDFAADAAAALAWLRARPGIAADAVGIVGHSEGGLVAPIVATEHDGVAWLVLLAGPGIPGLEILERQSALINRASGVPEDAVARSVALFSTVAAILRDHPDPETAEAPLRAVLTEATDALPPDLRGDDATAARAVDQQVVQLNSPWFRYFLEYDPAPTLERVRAPVLALNGEKDLQVPADVNLSAIEAALARGGNPDVTVRALPGLNHLFQLAETGAPAEYATIDETMNPAALEAVSGWILERFGGRRR